MFFKFKTGEIENERNNKIDREREGERESTVILIVNNAPSERLFFCSDSLTRLNLFLSICLLTIVHISYFNFSKNAQCTVNWSFSS